MKSKNFLWDRELSLTEFRALKRSHKHIRVVTSIQRKVTELESGQLSNAEILRLAGDRTKFRKWQDAKKGLWSWSVADLDAIIIPKTGEPGPNKKLMERWYAVVQAARGAPTAAEPVQPATESVLERQYIDALARIASLEEALARSIRHGER
ncbi:hypothetical protein [Rhizobium leguminosarum]|uniref:hypothetical protein n=1 Tax=Rhizobium leguminosarum TaxID=384 RepID=UPI001C8FA8D4|nr:hypothetical protein [Rhizobium leguminosarum]MBY2986665.1 hypothetical protein [Rhizobium leguminosarum]